MIGTSFLRVAAHDDDFGTNAAVTYSMSSEQPEYLRVNPLTGWVYVNQPISQVCTHCMRIYLINTFRTVPSRFIFFFFVNAAVSITADMNTNSGNNLSLVPLVLWANNAYKTPNFTHEAGYEPQLATKLTCKFSQVLEEKEVQCCSAH